MIVLRTPKGWTGPKEVDGVPVEGTWRAHQVPFADARDDDGAPRGCSRSGCASYRPEELFDADGAPRARRSATCAPAGDRRMSANPHANGGLLLQALRLPDFRDYARRRSPQPGTGAVEPTRVLGTFLRDVMARRTSTRLPRLRPGRERLQPARRGPRGHRQGLARPSACPCDDHLAPDGRVMEILSEHTCQGWLEGYLLTGRHGFFSCYEAFIHIVDSMFNQHAKWLKTTNGIPWRRPIASLNYLLTSHVWRQDHNGFSHQDPGFIDHVVNKKADVVRVYLPPDANTLLSVADHCLRSRQYVNVIVAGKQPALQYLDMDDGRRCTAPRASASGTWASTDDGGEPDVVLACAGDVPTHGDPRRRRHPPRVLARPAGPGGQRRRPDAAAGRHASTRTGCPTPSSTPTSPPTSR